MFPSETKVISNTINNKNVTTKGSIDHNHRSAIQGMDAASVALAIEKGVHMANSITSTEDTAKNISKSIEDSANSDAVQNISDELSVNSAGLKVKKAVSVSPTATATVEAITIQQSPIKETAKEKAKRLKKERLEQQAKEIQYTYDKDSLALSAINNIFKSDADRMKEMSEKAKIMQQTMQWEYIMEKTSSSSEDELVQRFHDGKRLSETLSAQQNLETLFCSPIWQF